MECKTNFSRRLQAVGKTRLLSVWM